MARQKMQPESGRRPNYLSTIASVALVLFLIGFFGLLLLQARYLVQSAREQIDLIVELRPENEEGAQAQVIAQLNGADFTRPGSVRFVSREEALEQMSEDMGEDILRLDLPNPLFDVVLFNVKADYLESDSLAHIRTLLQANPAVSDVFYQESLIDKIAGNATRIGWIALFVGLFLIGVAMVLIHNTIRLALHANRFVIKTQELVGATWGFISRPFLRQAIWHGFISSLLAIAALLGVQVWMQTRIPDLPLLEQPVAIGILFVLLLLLGISISWGSTYYVVRKYLRLRVDELY